MSLISIIVNPSEEVLKSAFHEFMESLKLHVGFPKIAEVSASFGQKKVYRGADGESGLVNPTFDGKRFFQAIEAVRIDYKLPKQYGSYEGFFKALLTDKPQGKRKVHEAPKETPAANPVILTDIKPFSPYFTVEQTELTQPIGFSVYWADKDSPLTVASTGTEHVHTFYLVVADALLVLSKIEQYFAQQRNNKPNITLRLTPKDKPFGYLAFRGDKVVVNPTHTLDDGLAIHGRFELVMWSSKTEFMHNFLPVNMSYWLKSQGIENKGFFRHTPEASEPFPYPGLN